VRIADAAELGFHQPPISDETLNELVRSSIELVPDCLREENRDRFRLMGQPIRRLTVSFSQTAETGST
jgi:hypothetical protein